jgi:hypothetical protein
MPCIVVSAPSRSTAPLGMYKNGNTAVSTTQATVAGWLAEENSTVFGNSLVIPTAGNYTLQTQVVVSASGSFGTVWIQLWIYDGSTPVVTGAQVPITRGTSGNVVPLASASPIACGPGAQISLQADAQTLNVIEITGGTGTWLRATPA